MLTAVVRVMRRRVRGAKAFNCLPLLELAHVFANRSPARPASNMYMYLGTFVTSICIQISAQSNSIFSSPPEVS